MIDLLLAPLAGALVILAIHAWLGLHVLAREIIFVDLAFAQIAALGATIAGAAGAGHGSLTSFAVAFGFTLIGAALFTFTRFEHPRISQEAIIGVTFVVASAAVLLVASRSAEGNEHVKETLTGTLLWVGWDEVGRLAAAYAVIGALHVLFRRPILAVSFAPRTLRHVRVWDFAFYVSFGLVITLSVEVAGVLLVFSMLVIPAAIALLFTARTGLALLLAWLAGTLAITGGIAVSFVWDLPTGPTLVCAFGLTLVVAGVLRLVPRPGSATVHGVASVSGRERWAGKVHAAAPPMR
ncbi:MAG: metal ABC transporter permease [Gemmatimonadota bacterium]|jgi:zinc/manganese transport system permease protein